MSNDIYRAPDVELAVDNSEVDELYAVSTRKFWIMHLLTFSLYDVYWFYRHWEQQNLRHNLGLWPAVRAVLFIFFVYSLFSRIQAAAKAKGLANVPNLSLLALVWYVLFFAQIGITIFYRDVFLTTVWPSPVMGVIGNVLSGFIFASVQRVANQVLVDEEGRKNSRITVANIAWIVAALLYNGLSLGGAIVRAS